MRLTQNIILAITAVIALAFAIIRPATATPPPRRVSPQVGTATTGPFKVELTRLRGHFLSYRERVYHGKGPYVSAGVPA